MEPTLQQGQDVLVSSTPYLFVKPKIDDIVLIRHSGKRRMSASRISPSPSPSPIGRGYGVRVSGQYEEESYKFLIKRITKIDPSADGEKYFVSGDNKKDSMDSRRFGWILIKDIVGKVIYKIRSP